MILGYKTYYPKWMTKKGWQTFFPEKINAEIKIHSFEWFKVDGKEVLRRKIIHWTDSKYFKDIMSNNIL